ncbi:hypothetical protein, conserved [Babesia bigemina]|uniref:Uncharacterized protein n=1 Tax=Babesia bigemina TaxID=5866 RepID=A0A061D4V0_BABBI|nr:hypothetical protein, conserved [Babesia bigemina]CDR95072.1 hypothetical protein, conserved [Babesia bigemina]|eukprot:XP_012767258.1 hypothetical protein, conserved [Babesia bigemina]
MSHNVAPNLVVMRLSQPSYECAAWQIIDASDALVALETESLDTVKQTAYTPTLVLPEYVNECFLGETLHLSILLSNSNKAACNNVKLKVDVVTEDAVQDPFVMEPLSGVTLEPHRKPYQTTISYLCNKQSQHNMTFIVTFTVGKRNYQVVKRAIWNVVNPIDIHFKSEKDSTGRPHLEATVTNICKHTLTVKDIKLVTPQDSTFQDPIYEQHKDVNGVCVLQPNGAYSVIFKNVKTTRPMQIKVFWHCYERGVGEINMPPIAYETIQHPGTVSLNDEFTIKFRVTNITKESLQCRLKFNQKQLIPLVVQVEDYLDFGGMAPMESKIIEVPFMSMEKGLHSIRGLEFCVMPDLIIPVTDLQVLAV